MGLSILIVDDEPAFCGFAGDALALEGFDVACAGSLAEAEDADAHRRPDVVLLDRCLPDGDGIDFLRLCAARGGPAPSVLMVTAYGNVESAVDALKLGATDYLIKPVSLAELVVRLRRLAESRSLRQAFGSAGARQRRGMADLVANSRPRRALVSQLHTVARSPTTPVLLWGPSGAGKQVAAEALHELTHGAGDGAPFVEVNCANLHDPSGAELFGRARREGSEAHPAQRGLLELASGGTLLLDDVGRLSEALQQRLLRFFDRMRFRPVGGAREVTVSLRVVATTNESPRALLERGAFSENFYHRIAVFVAPVAALATCREDIRPLSQLFLRHYADKLGKPVRALDAQAAGLLQRYEFPGNARELRNLLERAVILCPGDTVQKEHLLLPPQTAAQVEASSFFSLPQLDSGVPPPLEQVERLYVRQVLQHFRGHRTAAAESLGISYPTFLRRLRELELVGSAAVVGAATGSDGGRAGAPHAAELGRGRPAEP